MLSGAIIVHDASPSLLWLLLSRSRLSTFATCAAFHSPPRAVAIPRAVSAAATARKDVAPVALISRMIGATLAAKRSAAAALALLPSLVATASLGPPSFLPFALAAASAAFVRCEIIKPLLGHGGQDVQRQPGGVRIIDRHEFNAGVHYGGEQVFPSTRHQRCWVHKTANVLNKVAFSVQVNMKIDLREIYGAPTRAAAEVAIDVFADKYNAKHDKAVACLTKDREALLAFFDFPAEHWDHLRTSNPIESVFATVRHRTVRTKGALSAKTAKLMVFKLVNAAAKTWRRLKGENQLPKVVQGIKFQNGIEVIKMSAHHAA